MIPSSVIKELKIAGILGDISEPTRIFEVAALSKESMRIIGALSRNVFVSKRSLKHILDQRGSDKIIINMPEIIEHPSKIVDNSMKRRNSFIFAKMNGKASGVVIEITKTPDRNRVVSAFPINKEYYRRLVDISGRAAVPPFATPSNREKSS